MSQNSTLAIKECPYCNEEIQLNAIKCKHCGEKLDNNAYTLTGFKTVHTAIFVVLTIVTLGIYPIVWIALNYKNFNVITPNDKKITAGWVITFTVLYLLSIVAAINLPDNNSCQALWFVLSLVLSYRMLRKLEIHAEEKYGKLIKHNSFAWFFFNIIYVNYAINSFSQRISKAS